MTQQGPSLITADEYETVRAIRAGRVVVVAREDYERLGLAATDRGALAAMDDLPAPARPHLAYAVSSLALGEASHATILATLNDRLAAIGAAPMPKSTFNRVAPRLCTFVAGVFDRLHGARLSWRSRVTRDRAVALFVIPLARSEFLDDVHRACVDYFGAGRAPSRSAIGRFAIHVRRVIDEGK